MGLVRLAERLATLSIACAVLASSEAPWPQVPCAKLANQSACQAAKVTPQCHPDGCRTFRRCRWSAVSSNCLDLPPAPPPQPCHEINNSVDCVWSMGRDCRWDAGAGRCKVPPPSPPLPDCILDHSCAHNGMSRVPPMGWRSWNVFGGQNNDSRMRAMMHALVDKTRRVDGVPTSLAEIGYVSAGMDDGYQQCNCSSPSDPYPHSLYNVSCSGGVGGQTVNACMAGRCTWHNQSDGSPMIDKLKFPDLKGLVAFGHSLGLQVGFYLNNCICMEKGRTYFEQDVAFLAEMQFDTVKIDQCGSAMNMSLWAALINATGRPMMLENCHNAPSWWSPGPDAARVCDSNMWRSGGDIGNGWSGAYSEAHQWLEKNVMSKVHPWGLKPISRPGCWGYPDMMEVGNFCSEGPGLNQRCFEEERAHFGLWCIVSSPLILGFDMSDGERMDRVWPIITNREAIAINRAWAGLPGTMYKSLHNGTVEIWAKPLPDNAVAILMLNTVLVPVQLAISVEDDVPGKPQGTRVRDVWNHAYIEILGGHLHCKLEAHDSLLAVFKQVQDPTWWLPSVPFFEYV